MVKNAAAIGCLAAGALGLLAESAALRALAHATGGDFGGSRTRANHNIAAAAHDLITGITSANRSFLEHR